MNAGYLRTVLLITAHRKAHRYILSFLRPTIANLAHFALFCLVCVELQKTCVNPTICELQYVPKRVCAPKAHAFFFFFFFFFFSCRHE